MLGMRQSNQRFRCKKKKKVECLPLQSMASPSWMPMQMQFAALAAEDVHQVRCRSVAHSSNSTH